jgi:3-phenylpropionate/cinnamic acid dioxygenase small subunit
MSQRSEIENALYRWAWCYDGYDLEGFLDCVTADASISVELSTGEVTGPLQGRAEIGEFFGARLAERSTLRRHVTTNVMILEESERAATTRCLLTLITEGDPGVRVAATGVYDDRLVHEDGVWRISERKVLLEVPTIPAP